MNTKIFDKSQISLNNYMIHVPKNAQEGNALAQYNRLCDISKFNTYIRICIHKHIQNICKRALVLCPTLLLE